MFATLSSHLPASVRGVHFVIAQLFRLSDRVLELHYSLHYIESLSGWLDLSRMPQSERGWDTVTGLLSWEVFPLCASGGLPTLCVIEHLLLWYQTIPEQGLAFLLKSKLGRNFKIKKTSRTMELFDLFYPNMKPKYAIYMIYWWVKTSGLSAQYWTLISERLQTQL